MRNALQIAAQLYGTNRGVTNALKEYVKENALFGAFSDKERVPLTEQQMQEEVALRALDAVTPFPVAGITIGRKGLENLGVNAERDLVGQYSGLWDKGVRAELDDVVAKVHPLIEDGSVHSWNMGSMGIDAKETMSHPALYDAYQDLGEMPTQGNIRGGLSDLIAAVEGKSPSNTRGSYSDAGIVIDVTPDEVKPTMMHELQHGVQRREGFARGGSPADFKSEYSVLSRQIDAINEEMDKALKVGDKNLYYALMDKRSEIVPRIQELQGQHGIIGVDQYERLAGEWEARNAGTRSVLDPTDPRLGNALDFNGVTFRSGQPFSTADDIALDDLIVMMDGGENLSHNQPMRVYRGEGKAQQKNGNFFSPDREYAESWGRVGGDDFNIVERELKNIFDATKAKEVRRILGDDSVIAKILDDGNYLVGGAPEGLEAAFGAELKKIQKLGYDSMKMEGFDRPVEYFVF